MERVLADKTLVQATYYYGFYVLEALRKAGLADRYVEQLAPWQEMLALGLTTTAESPEPTRSDSHAWSAHPNYGLLATVLGVRPAKPGFRSVRIAPQPRPLEARRGPHAAPARRHRGASAARRERRGSGPRSRFPPASTASSGGEAASSRCGPADRRALTPPLSGRPQWLVSPNSAQLLDPHVPDRHLGGGFDLDAELVRADCSTTSDRRRSSPPSIGRSRCGGTCRHGR